MVKGMEMTRATGFSENERQAVYRAIRERNPQAARDTMREHLELAFQAQQQEPKHKG